LIEGRLSSEVGRSELVKLATRLIIEEGLEAEVRDGLREGRLKTAEGFIAYSAPQVAGGAEPFRSELRDHLKGHSEALEDLAVEMLARGLSVRDIEDAFKTETGRLLLSRTAVSELGERLWADYQDFATRDLSEYDIAYLFVDGVAERIRPGQRREPVLAAWGFTAEGRKVLLHLMAGSKEDAETVTAFFQDLRARGLGDPLLVVSDGAPGIIKAIETCFPRSERQRCLAHRMRNLVVKVPEDLWPDFKERARAAYQAPSRKIARDLAEDLVADYEAELPSALACFRDDFEACIAHLRMPVTHRRAVRTTNLLERLFLEERRRLKIIPNAFGEKAVLKLMFAAMTRAADRWRAVKITDFERHQMAAVRAELDQEYEARTGLAKQTSKDAKTTKLSSKSRT
jgi:transposase-like protein